MFQSIEFREDPNSEAYPYELIDSEFGLVKRSVFCDSGSAMIRRTVVIVNIYESRGLPVALNVARFLVWQGTGDMPVDEELDYLRRRMSRYHPELQYEAKYHQCVVNQ